VERREGERELGFQRERREGERERKPWSLTRRSSSTDTRPPPP